MMKKICICLLVLMLGNSTLAQKVTIEGIVVEDRTGKAIGQARVNAGGSDVSVVTNDDGYFVLKTDEKPSSIIVSHINFHSRKVVVDEIGEKLTIKLSPSTINLREIVVRMNDPRKLVDAAIKKIPQNYCAQPECYECFYRESAMKRQHYIYVAEGVVDMYKTGYNRSAARDRVAIRKGRRLVSSRQKDTLGVKVLGGPVQPIQLDMVKNLDFLLNKEELDGYTFKMGVPASINERPQFVVEISPLAVKPYPLFFGKLYIDCESLAFTRIELDLDMADRKKATDYMLFKKPIGVKFKPKELSCIVDYKADSLGVTRISYIRNVFRFNCDWKKRFFSNAYTAVCEMVVTDRTSLNVQLISGRSSFDTHDAFYDQVDFFLDSDFWKYYNIIEPSIRLDKAVEKIIKRIPHAS